MKRIQVTDATYRTLVAMADTDGVTLSHLVGTVAARELDRRRLRYDAAESVRDLNRAIQRG